MNVFTQGNISIVQTNEQFTIVVGEKISNPLPLDLEVIQSLIEMISSNETIIEITERWANENQINKQSKKKE